MPKSACPSRRGERRPYPLKATVEIDESAVLLQERRRRQHHVGELRGLAEEDLLHDDQLAGRNGLAYVAGVGVGLRYVLPHDIQRLEAAIDCGVEHLRYPQARFRRRLCPQTAPTRSRASGSVTR